MQRSSAAARLVAGTALGILLGLSGPVRAAEPPAYVLFESGHVRPLALSPNGQRLFAVNTPDARLEIFAVTADGLEPRGSVAVGLEPVAVAARSDTEVWVVNHLSDSVSVVDVASESPRVARTLLVGDEPRDIVFAGPGRQRAFVTTAHRGQHRTDASLAGVPGAGDPQLTTPGIGRADVWVFDAGDAAALSAGPGGKPIALVTLFGDTPRALAVSPDGGTVYAGIFLSGNQTAVVPEPAVCDGFSPTDLPDACPDQFPGAPGGNPGPATTRTGAPAPEVGLVVRWNDAAGEWQDELGRGWNAALPFRVPDLDVFAIDASSLEVEASFAHVGTTLFDIAVHPQSGRLFVTNTEARNDVRFEGPGTFGGSTVQGRLAEARVTVIDPATSQVRAVHLNSHLDYSVTPAPAEAMTHSLSMPLGAVFSEDGATLYVVAFGSARVGALPVAALEGGTFDPTAASAGYLEVSGGGPSGLVLDAEGERLFVATRFDNAVSVIDLATGVEAQHVTMHTPEPAEVVEGRRFLYDARATSSNGEASCASCHVFGDFDGLAWDLGNTDGDVTFDPIPIRLGEVAPFFFPNINGTGIPSSFHPMKGPMTTQTLRGMANSGAMHWRGDRAVGVAGTDPFDAAVSFRNFNAAFPDLLGRAAMLNVDEMEAFTEFVLRITLPPNPVRALDDALGPAQQRGRDLFIGPRLMDGVPLPDLGFTCEGCHRLDPAQGFFGTDGRQSFENEAQIIKIPHLRNVYQKVGMFGNAANTFFLPGDNAFMGDQVRGTGFLHDGSVDTLFRFLHATVFAEALEGTVGFQVDAERRDVEQFLLAFDSDLAPVVGQQVTLRAENSGAAGARADVLRARAGAAFVSKVLGGEVTECDLVAHAVVGGIARGYLFDPVAQRFSSDRAAEAPITDGELRGRAALAGQPLTYTCVPPGSGERLALDRDLDGFFDRDELDAGSDPADAGSRPASCVAGAERLCLVDDRFEVTVSWRDAEGETGSARAVPFRSDDSGLLFFFDPDNWEMLVKVLDGCAINDRYWVFAAATTDVEYTLRVFDTSAGEERTYSNPLGTASAAITDTDAFVCGAGSSTPGSQSAARTASLGLPSQTPRVARAPGSGACTPGDTALCLAGGRFRVELAWTANDVGGPGRVVPFGSDDSGLLWFFEPDNWEVLLKVLDGCSVNERFWVFAAATTNVEYTLQVTDTATGEVREYHNEAGTPAPALTDTGAFASCTPPP